MEKALSPQAVVSVLTRSPHGDLSQYAATGNQAAQEDAGFFGKLVAWNARKGSIRDSKVALPVIALSAKAAVDDPELRENALAHIAQLRPRELVRAVKFARTQKVPRSAVDKIAAKVLRHLESNEHRFDRVAVQHRATLKELYVLTHTKPADRAKAILFEREKIGVFADIASLHTLSPVEIASVIQRRRLPFLTTLGALGGKMKEPAVLQALIGAMTPTELATNTKMLMKLGVQSDAGLRAAFEVGLKRIAESDSTQATLKTTVAADMVGGVVGEKLKGAQEKALDKLSVEGDWAVLADVSGSMHVSIDAARQVASLLGRVGKGAVHLVFYNTAPTYFNVTGKTLEEITSITARMVANGGTAPGCALNYLLERGIEVDGIVVVGDLNENNTPYFTPTYKKYAEKFGRDPALYAFQLKGDPPTLLLTTKQDGVDMQTFDLTHGTVDRYSLPALIQTMRTQRYSLLDEIREVPYLRLADVLR